MTGKELNTVLEKIAVHFKDLRKKPVIVFHAAEPLLVKDILFASIKNSAVNSFLVFRQMHSFSKKGMWSL